MVILQVGVVVVCPSVNRQGLGGFEPLTSSGRVLVDPLTPSGVLVVVLVVVLILAGVALVGLA